MKKILFSALLALGAFSIANAQAPCTPDVAALNNSTGIVPDTTTNFVKGCLNQPYSQVISVRVPFDTTAAQLGGQTVQINYVQVTAVNGLPPGFSYECMTPDCKFPGGTDGCAIVTGPADQLGEWPLNVKLKANVKIDLVVTTQDVDNDMDDVNGWKIIVEDCDEDPTDPEEPTNATFNLKNNASFNVYPNPAVNQVIITNLTDNGIVKNIKVMSTSGQIVGEFTTTNDAVKFDTSNLNAGIYFIQVTQNNQKEVVKLIVE